MPALPVIADTAIVFQRLAAADARSVMGNRMCVSFGAGLDPGQIADSFADAYATQLLPQLSNEIVLRETEVLILDGASPVAVISSSHVGDVGGYAHPSLPYNNNAVITWRTLTRGRSHRGRSYMPGISPDFLTAGDGYRFSGGFVSSLTSAGLAFLAALGGEPNPLELQVLSLHLGATTAVDHCSVNGNLTIQRRRVEKVSRH